ncbi:MAG: hypothetical protein HC801_01590 [Nitrospira sp.]|nr:hypothetical protein [Nitrospira sp.]
MKITEVVPVAQSGDGARPQNVGRLSETMTTTPVVANKVLPTPVQTSPGGSE